MFINVEPISSRFIVHVYTSVHSGSEMGYFKGFDELISLGDAPNRQGVNETEDLIETSVYMSSQLKLVASSV